MLLTLLRAKLHRLTVTQADLNYIGSIALDPDLLEAAGLFEGEKVQIVNINTVNVLKPTRLQANAVRAKWDSTARLRAKSPSGTSSSSSLTP